MPATPSPLVESRTRIPAIRLPRPIWFAILAGALIVLAIGLRVGMPLYRQRVAMTEIEERGGYVVAVPVGPTWLRRAMGSQFAGSLVEVTIVELRGKEFGDEDLKLMAAFPDLLTLRLRDSQITDAGLKDLANLSRLERLWLGGTEISDEGLAHLGTMTQLKELILSRTGVTDAGLSRLSRLPQLGILQLENTKTTDAGLEELLNFPHLWWVNLEHTNVTDQGLCRLLKLKRLAMVHIGGTKATAESIARLRAKGVHVETRAMSFPLWPEVPQPRLTRSTPAVVDPQWVERL